MSAKYRSPSFGGRIWPGDRVAGPQAELPDLRRRDVDVVRAGEVVVLGRAEEAEAVRQHLEDALREDQAEAFGLRLQDLEDQLLLAQRGRALDLELLRDLEELRHGVVVERPDVEHRLRRLGRDGDRMLFDVGGQLARIDRGGGVVGAGDFAAGHGELLQMELGVRSRSRKRRARPGRFSPVSDETGWRGRVGSWNSAVSRRSWRTRCDGFTASHFVAATTVGTHSLLSGRAPSSGRSPAARGGCPREAARLRAAART